MLPTTAVIFAALTFTVVGGSLGGGLVGMNEKSGNVCSIWLRSVVVDVWIVLGCVVAKGFGSFVDSSLDVVVVSRTNLMFFVEECRDAVVVTGGKVVDEGLGEIGVGLVVGNGVALVVVVLSVVVVGIVGLNVVVVVVLGVVVVVFGVDDVAKFLSLFFPNSARV